MAERIPPPERQRAVDWLGLPEGKLEFAHGDLSLGLPGLKDDSFDGVIAGLSLSYAESKDPITGKYTDSAFRGIFREIHRVLKPGGLAWISEPIFAGEFNDIFCDLVLE